MYAKNILFPTDFSKSSEAALVYASALAAESGALLHLLHVSNDSSAYLASYSGFGYAPELAGQVMRENRERLANVTPTVPHVRHKHHCVSGVPEIEILALAEREHVDLIVIGSHGRTGIPRLLLGSIAESVVRRASCPVITVKQPVNQIADSENEPNQQSPTENLGPASKCGLR